MQATLSKLITADEFILMPEPEDGSKEELVKGVVETVPPPGFEHGECQAAVAALIYIHVKSNRIGRVVTESGVRTEEDPDTVRGPDVSYWSAERLPLNQRVQGYPEIAPDLCVEVVTKHTSRKKLRAKADEYLFAGVRMIWIVDPEERTVEIVRNPEESRTLSEKATLTGEDVLPGFECKVAELFG